MCTYATVPVAFQRKYDEKEARRMFIMELDIDIAYDNKQKAQNKSITLVMNFYLRDIVIK